MSVNLSPVGGVAAQFFDNNGNPLSGGKLYCYVAGTTIPAVAYTAAQGNVPWSNPIVFDAAGRVPNSGEIWLTDGIIYKFVLKNSNNVVIATYDNVTGINSSAFAYTNRQEIFTATDGQTVFTLSNAYKPGTNSLSVFVDGVNQYGPGAQYSYIETDATTVTFNDGLHEGAQVKFTTTQQQGAGAVDAIEVSYDPPFVGSVPTNVEAKLAQILSVEDFTSLSNAIAAAKVGNKIVCLFEDTTIQVPTDAANLQDVFDFVTTAATQIQVTVNFVTGYQIASSLTLSNGSWSNFNITSTDATVYLADDFAYTDDIFNFNRVTAPKISVLINAQGKGRHGINATNCSSIYVAPNKGVIYAGYFGCYVNAGSTGYVDGSNFSYAGALSTNPTYIAGATGISARRGSLLNARASDVSNSEHYGMSADQSSKINAQYVIANNCVSYGVRAVDASEILAQYGSANNCKIGFYALGGATIACDTTTATGCTDYGYYAANASIINAASTDASNAQDTGYYALDGSTINALLSTANNCGDRGFYAHRSSVIEAHNSTANSNGTVGFFASQTSTINAETSTSTGNGTYGIFATRAAFINANQATSTGNTNANVYSERGSTINFVNGIGASATTLDNIYVSNAGIIAANSATGTLRITANTLTASGIIFQ